MKFEKSKRDVGALIDIDHNKDDLSNDDNDNFVKIGNNAKGSGYDYEGDNDN